MCIIVHLEVLHLCIIVPSHHQYTAQEVHHPQFITVLRALLQFTVVRRPLRLQCTIVPEAHLHLRIVQEALLHQYTIARNHLQKVVAAVIMELTIAAVAVTILLNLQHHLNQLLWIHCHQQVLHLTTIILQVAPVTVPATDTRSHHLVLQKEAAVLATLVVLAVAVVPAVARFCQKIMIQIHTVVLLMEVEDLV